MNQGGTGAAAGYSAPVCPGPIYLRVRNASKVNFDSADVSGIQFGAVRAGARSKYQQAQGCVYSYGHMRITSGKQRFMVFPIDFVGEQPLSPGYYTQALTPEPPDGVSNVISKDSRPAR